MKNLLIYIFVVFLLYFGLLTSCQSDKHITYGDLHHEKGDVYIPDKPNIYTITVTDINDIKTQKVLDIKNHLSNESEIKVNINIKGKDLAFVLKKYKNFKIVDDDKESIVGVGYLNHYGKNRAYMIITDKGDLYAYYILDDIFYILKKNKQDSYILIDRNAIESRSRYLYKEASTNPIMYKEPILVTREFLGGKTINKKGKHMNLNTAPKSSTKISHFLNVVINVTGKYSLEYPGSLYDNIYALIHSFYSSFLTIEDKGLDLEIGIYIYHNKLDTTPWSYNSEEYLDSWRLNAVKVFPGFQNQLANTIFVNMHLDTNWDGGSTIGRAYVATEGLGNFVIVGYADAFYSGAMQTLSHEVGHSLGARHIDNTFSKYNLNIYDVMQPTTGLPTLEYKYREDHLDQKNIRRILSNWTYK